MRVLPNGKTKIIQEKKNDSAVKSTDMDITTETMTVGRTKILLKQQAYFKQSTEDERKDKFILVHV